MNKPTRVVLLGDADKAFKKLNEIWRIRLIMLSFVRILQTENLGQRATQLSKFSVVGRQIESGKEGTEEMQLLKSIRQKRYCYLSVRFI